MGHKKITAINHRAGSLVKQMLAFTLCVIFVACQGLGKKHRPVNANGSENEDNIVLNRPGYTLAYPVNWHIDSSSKLYDIDGHFTLHSPVESGLITVFFFNVSKDEKETLEKHIHAQLENSMKDGTVSYFTKWGNYQGHGASLKGRLEGSWKSELKIFVYSNKEQSFLITSICADGYRDEVIPGLNLIESSLKLKPPTQVQVPVNHS